MLEFKNINFSYNNTFKLKDINFDVNKGEFLGIIGPNGSGKTTILYLLLNFLKPNSGEIVLESKNIMDMHFKEIARIVSFVPQNHEMLISLSVFEYVLMGRIPHRKPFQFFESKEDLEKTKKVIAKLNITHLENKKFYQLSGGEQQLCVIAKAINQESEMLVIDEPTNHLDISYQFLVLNLLKKINVKYNLTIITVFHDLNLASIFCDRIILMNKGEIFKKGTPNEIINPESLKQVYNMDVLVNKHPLKNIPYILYDV